MSKFLIINDLFHNGWKAILDGIPVEIERVNYIFKGIEIPAGNHHLELRFMPSGFIFGVSLSIATLLIIILLFRLRKLW